MIDIRDVELAAKRIRPYVHRTPVMTSSAIDDMVGAKIYFKCENLQKTGAFKIRGATNAIGVLKEKDGAGLVATHSSGNHGAALACAARAQGIDAYVVMPENTPTVKKNATRSYGAHIRYCAQNLKSREEETARVLEETGAALVHPYDDFDVIAGQGTVALELLEQTPILDVVMTPVGGGGLVSGVATVVAEKSLKTRVIAAEPEGADDTFNSFKQGKIIPLVTANTIADGLRSSLSEKTFAIIYKLVSQVVTVSDADILDAMRTVWERMKIIIEPSSAVPLAAILAGKIDVSNQSVGIILTGGNVDFDNLQW